MSSVAWDDPFVLFKTCALPICRLHIKPSTLPDELAQDPEKLVDLVFETKEQHYYKVVDASRGDDMDMGRLRFIVATCMPWGRKSL